MMKKFNEPLLSGEEQRKSHGLLRMDTEPPENYVSVNSLSTFNRLLTFFQNTCNIKRVALSTQYQFE